jgi:alpha-tubulin suppressor-like RCC1 family protein
LLYNKIKIYYFFNQSDCLFMIQLKYINMNLNKFLKKIVIFIVVFSMLPTNFPVGIKQNIVQADGPIQISTWTQLNNIRITDAGDPNYIGGLSGSYILTDNLQELTEGYSIYAGPNANTEAGWEPLGDSTVKFKGSFDGNNYTIRGLYINRPSQDNIGLFGYTEKANINNIILEDVDIRGASSVGGLVGYLFGHDDIGSITNSSASGNIIGGEYVGGLVGYNDSGSITNSSASGNITGEGYVGGLVGYNGNGTISASYSTGNATTLDYSAGGLVGGSDGIINNSYATGNVAGEMYVGGLIAENYGIINNSYATGNVSGTSNLGGLVVYNESEVTNSFWDIEASGQAVSDGGEGKTTVEMKNINTYLDVQVLEEENIIWQSVSAGNAHTLAIKGDGTLWAWGSNWGFQLGLGDDESRKTPTQVGSSTDWQSVSAGDYHNLAIKTDGTLWAWGMNEEGQLGLGNNTTTNTPTQVGSSTDWQSVSAGNAHTLAIKGDGTLWAWGNNDFGQLGVSLVGKGPATTTNTPTQVGSSIDWRSVSAGKRGSADNGNTLAIKTDGTLWAWGANSEGQLGLGNNTTTNTPTQVGGSTDWQNVSTDYSSTFGIQTDGTLWAWGWNATGQLGLGDYTNKNAPTQVETSTDWQSVSHAIAVKTDGTLWISGPNFTQVGTSTDWQSVSSSDTHTLATKASNALWAWGSNWSGKLGLGDYTNRDTPTKIIKYNLVSGSGGLDQAWGF